LKGCALPRDFFITEVFIEKLRHLKEIKIPLSDTEKKHLILTGKNGSGKTSFLNVSEDIEKRLTTILGSPRFEKTNSIRVDLFGKGQKIQFQVGNLSKASSIHNKVFAFFGAKRSLSPLNPEGPVKKIEYLRNPSHYIIQHAVNLKVQRSFARDDGDMNVVDNIDRWFDRFEGSLQEIFEDSHLQLVFDRKNYNFIILQSDHEPFDFATMSDGYSAFFAIVADIIMRMEVNRREKDYGGAYDQSGIVLIDELEAHLHIGLQKTIFPFLTSFFPNIQFIVTTHSPFVLSSAKDAVIFDLEKQIQVEDLSGYAYDGLVESYFSIDKYSQEIKNRLAEYEDLVKREDLSEDDHDRMLELRAELREIPGKLSPELKAEFQRIELDRKGSPA
jgi:predicted ATP-binding protein involved in virulence